MTRKKNLRGQISKDKGLISTVNETPDKIRPANEKQQLTQHPQDPPNPSQQPLQILPHLHLPHQIPKIPIPLIRPLPKSPLILPQPLPIHQPTKPPSAKHLHHHHHHRRKKTLASVSQSDHHLLTGGNANPASQPPTMVPSTKIALNSSRL